MSAPPDTVASTPADLRRSSPSRARDGPFTARPHRRAWLIPILASAAFLILQMLLAVLNEHEVRQAIAAQASDGFEAMSLLRRIGLSVPSGGFVFGGLCFGGILMARRGRRAMSLMPAAAYVLLPALTSGHMPHPIGTEWGSDCFASWPNPWFACSLWMGAAADLLLVLVPILAAWPRGGRPGLPPDAEMWPGLALALLWVLIVLRTTQVVNGRLPDTPLIVAVVSFAVGAGARRPWWPWAHILIAAGVSGLLGDLTYAVMMHDPHFTIAFAARDVGEELVPFAALALLASGWEEVSHVLRRASAQPIRLLVLVNGLNLADALFTQLSVHAGTATEMNPVVRYGGLPVKIAGVGLLSWLLLRRSPRALVWPVVVLAAVICYHVSGFVVNG